MPLMKYSPDILGLHVFFFYSNVIDNSPATIPGKTTPGTEHIWQWWCETGCSQNATSSCFPSHPSSHQWAEITEFSPPPGALGWPPPESW